ncbi:MAG: hypothetical protein HZC37_03425 [Burkholderiales bacterium]|nr:hypothetical protein [Burkholderiales bacterium]
MTDAEPRRQRLGCPSCGGSVRRRRRSALQRWLLRDPSLARYRCAAAACAWTGLLTRDLGPDAAAAVQLPRPWPLRTRRSLVPLMLAGAAVLAAHWGSAQAPVADVPVGARLFAAGEAFDGEALPLAHPLLVPASLQVPANAGGEAPSPRLAALTLRRFCAWGRPGRMPYRGTVDEALRAAQLPAGVRAQIGAAIAAGRPHDRLSIGNDAIRALSGTRTFEADGFAMTYGRTLCLGTRVNFRPGHVEPASLYEAFDDSGRRYSVMVPDTCGNVSVLKARGERGLPRLAGGGTRLAAADPLDPGPADPRVMHAVLSGKPNEVPTPGTLALAGVALAAAVFAARPKPNRPKARERAGALTPSRPSR